MQESKFYFPTELKQNFQRYCVLVPLAGCDFDTSGSDVGRYLERGNTRLGVRGPNIPMN